MGMATYIEQSVNNALDHYVVTSSDAVIGVLTPVAVTAVTLYVLWTGSTWLGAPRSDGGLALVLALALTLPGYALGRFGAGDVKLLAALGLASNTEYLLGSLIGAGIAMVAWALMHQGLSSSHVERDAQVSTKQPFAPFVLTGYAACWLWIH